MKNKSQILQELKESNELYGDYIWQGKDSENKRRILAGYIKALEWVLEK